MTKLIAMAMIKVSPHGDDNTANEFVRRFTENFPSLDTVGGAYLLYDALDGKPDGLSRALACASNASEWSGRFQMNGEELVLFPHCGDRVLRVATREGGYRLAADFSARPSGSEGVLARGVAAFALRYGGTVHDADGCEMTSQDLEALPETAP